MSARVLVVDSSAAMRAMVDRALSTAGHGAHGVSSVREARAMLDGDAVDVALVDQLAGDGLPLDEVRLLRAMHPRVPVVVMGTTLTAPALVELLRLGVSDALPRPFTPAELRDVVARALARAAPAHLDALDHAAALRAALLCLSQHETARAAMPLARAWARSPLDAETAALEALRAELEGRDDDAARGYRAAAALRGDDPLVLDPLESLERLDVLANALPVERLDARFDGARVYVTDRPARCPDDRDDAPRITVMPLSLSVDAPPAMHLRVRGHEAFAVCLTDARPARLGALLARLGDGPLDASPPLDAAALRDAREAAR